MVGPALAPAAADQVAAHRATDRAAADADMAADSPAADSPAADSPAAETMSILLSVLDSKKRVTTLRRSLGEPRARDRRRSPRAPSGNLCWPCFACPPRGSTDRVLREQGGGVLRVWT